MRRRGLPVVHQRWDQQRLEAVFFMRLFSARLIIHHSTLYGRTNRVRWRTKGGKSPSAEEPVRWGAVTIRAAPLTRSRKAVALQLASAFIVSVSQSVSLTKKYR